MHERILAERKDFNFYVDVEFEKLPYFVTHVRLLDIRLRITSIKFPKCNILLSLLPQLLRRSMS